MKKSKFIVKYDKEGGVFSDFKVLSVLESFIDGYKVNQEELAKNNEDYIIVVGTGNFLTGVRLAVAEGRLNYDDVVIVYEKNDYHLDKYVAYKEVFKLENFQQKLLEKILQANFKMEES